MNQRAQEEERIATRRSVIVEDAWRKVMGTPEGKVVMWEILAEGGLFKNPYTGNAETNFLCGKQHMAQWVLDEIAEVSPHILGQMIVANAALEDEIEKAIRDETDEHE